MKRFNLFFGLFLVSFATLMIYACERESTKEDKATESSHIEDTEIRDIGESCKSYLYACKTDSIAIFHGVTLDAYPGCTLSIKVNYCQITHPVLGTEIFIGNYTILNLSGCAALLNELDELTLDGEINAFVNALDLMIYTRLEDFFWASHGSHIGCGSPGVGNLIITFIKAGCGTICTYHYGTNPEGPEPGLVDGTELRDRINIGVIVRANCTSEGCCRRSTRICYDPALDEVVKMTTATVYPMAIPAPVQCASGVVEYPDVPTGLILASCTPCTFSCQ
jgi:hypothetical protein